MFQLSFDIPPSPVKISHEDRVLLVGSCFSEEIGAHLTRYKFNIRSNPFGTIYNPASLFENLTRSLSPTAIAPDELTQSQGIHLWWKAHSKISAESLDELKDQATRAMEAVGDYLRRASWLIITPGTAWVYQLMENGSIVANCHKQPSSRFEKRLLSVQEILKSFDNFHQLLRQHNPTIQILWTVSPVRHVRDGLVANNQSKGTLHLALREIIENYPSNHYFPSYEIICDELRDYRFFESDRIHPSQEAIEYIWQKFQTCFFTEKTRQLVDKWRHILKALEHKAFNPQSPMHQKFLQATLSNLQELSGDLDVSPEVKFLQNQLQH